MTDQISDHFLYQRREYSLAGYSAEVPFHPGALGMEPEMPDTSCWRGYQLTYGLAGARLLLIRLLVNLVVDTKDYKRVAGPVIDGVWPVEVYRGNDDFNNHYINLQYPLEYTGSLFLGSDLIEEFADDIIFPDAWYYRELLELKFHRGRLTETVDFSAKVADIQVIALQQQTARQLFFNELIAAKKSGREELVEEIKKKRGILVSNPPPGEDYDAQISALVSEIFACNEDEK
ncbi:MAG: hypothetical protein JKY93_04715 [Gammaproteobacteria bacterium]|nr:hypothetical protein [Gammaproteobacteria bacterium]